MIPRGTAGTRVQVPVCDRDLADLQKLAQERRTSVASVMSAIVAAELQAMRPAEPARWVPAVQP